MTDKKLCKTCGTVEAAPGRSVCIRCKNQATYKKNMTPCKCGCGELAARDYIWGHHTRLFSPEEQARRGRQNDGSTQRDRGLCIRTYRKVRGRHEHRVIMEELIGRPLTYEDVVHHKNGNLRDNSEDNLELTTRQKHIETHRRDLLEGKRRATQK